MTDLDIDEMLEQFRLTEKVRVSFYSIRNLSVKNALVPEKRWKQIAHLCFIHLLSLHLQLSFCGFAFLRFLLVFCRLFHGRCARFGVILL